MRPVRRCLLLLAGVLCLAPPLLRAQAPEPAIIELKLGRVAARTVPAWQAGGTVLVPLTQFLDLAEIRGTLERPGRMTGTFATTRQPFVVDTAGPVATIGGRVVALGPADLLAEGAELFVAAPVLADLFGIELEVDWAALEVVVRDPARLPLADRLRREAARRALPGAAGALEPELLHGVSASRIGGFVLDYSLFTPSTDPLGGSAWSVAAGASVVGGSLEVAARSDGPAAAGDVRLDASWLGVWRNRPWLRQLRLGDGTGTGTRPRQLRGVSLSNAPYLRPSLLAAADYDGAAPAGWEVEAWRNGVLVGLDSADATGAWHVSLPVLYGENPVEFVAYGPYGERRDWSRKYLVPLSLLPADRVEYGLSAGACRLDACDAMLNADVRYGLSSRWTASAGLDRFWADSAGHASHPYAGVVGIMGGSWILEGDAIGAALVRGRVAYEPTLDLRIAAEVTRFDRDVASRYNPLGARNRWQVGGFWRPDARRSFLYVDARAEVTTTAAGTLVHGRTGVSLRMGNVRAVPYVRLMREALAGGGSTSAFAGLELFAVPDASWGALFRRTWLRAALEARGASTPTMASLTVARPLAPSVRAEAGVTWTRGGRGPSFTFALATLFPSLRAHTLVTAPAHGDMAATQFLQGSVLYDEARQRVAFTAGPSLQRGGVAGRVFLDENANGVRDPSEPGLEGVRVQVGAASAWSDSLGFYRVWDAVPFEPVLLEPDSLSFASPLWVNPRAHAAVVPAPNRLTVVDVPLLLGAVLEGAVLEGDRSAGPGLVLELEERESGRVRRLSTFSDGTFYALGITAGRWELRLAPGLADRLNVTVAPVRFDVAPGATEVPPVALRLEPRVSPAPASTSP